MEGGALAALRALRLGVGRRRDARRRALRARWAPSPLSPWAGWTASGSGHSSASATAHFGGARKVARIAYTLSLERPTTFRRAGGPERATRVESGEEIGKTGQEQQRSATAEKTPQKARFQSRDLRPQAGHLGVYLGGQNGQVATGDGLVAARQSVVAFRRLIDRGHRRQATGCIRRRSTGAQPTAASADLPITQKALASAGTLPLRPRPGRRVRVVTAVPQPTRSARHHVRVPVGLRNLP